MPKPTQIFPESLQKRWLPDHAEVWRYVPLRTLFFYLNGLVFIPSVAKLRADDPFEGEFYEDIAWFNSAFSDHYGGEANAIEEWMLKELCSDHERQHIKINRNYPNAGAEVYRRQYFDFIRRTRFAWCWFQSYRESAAMWSVYGNQGVAIKSTVGKLSSVLEKTGREFIYGRMTYVDYRSGISTDFNPEHKSDYRLLLRPFFLKRREYESENEVRFVTSGVDREERGGILLKELLPQQWISEIRLWPGLTHDEEESIKKAVHHFVSDADCQKSDLFSGPDGPSELAEMITADLEQSADLSWAEGKDEIPQSLKRP
jgi:hypothetical protein